MEHQTSLRTTTWDVAIGCLEARLPSIRQFVPVISALTADAIHNAVEMDFGIELQWHLLQLDKLTDDAIIASIDPAMAREDETYIVNDFTYAASIGPFLTTGNDLRKWVKSYRENVSPSRRVLDGDTFIWNSEGIYVISHEDVCSSFLFSNSKNLNV